MARTIATVYNDRDNVVDLALYEDGTLQELVGSVTAAAIVVNGTTYHSDDHATAFDWTVGDGVLRLALGELELPTGKHPARLIIFDALNTDGIVWFDEADAAGLDLLVKPG